MVDSLSLSVLFDHLPDEDPNLREVERIESPSGSHKCISVDLSTHHLPFITRSNSDDLALDWPAFEKWSSVECLNNHYGKVTFTIGGYNNGGDEPDKKSGQEVEMKLGQFLESLESRERKIKRGWDDYNTSKQLQSVSSESESTKEPSDSDSSKHSDATCGESSLLCALHISSPYLVERRWSHADQLPIVEQDYTHPPPPFNSTSDLLSAAIPSSAHRAKWKSRYWWIGGSGSGSHLHIDHCGCFCGWNTLVFGKKRWLFIDPESVTFSNADGSKELNLDRLWFEYGLEVVGGELSGSKSAEAAAASAAKRKNPIQDQGENHSAKTLTLNTSTSILNFMRNQLPRLRKQLNAKTNDKKSALFETIQYPGDTVYVPAGWLHCVLNLEIGCAIAESFLPPGQIFEEELWGRLCKEQSTFAHVLRECLQGIPDAETSTLNDDRQTHPWPESLQKYSSKTVLGKELVFVKSRRTSENHGIGSQAKPNVKWWRIEDFESSGFAILDSSQARSHACNSLRLLLLSYSCLAQWFRGKPSIEKCRKLESVEDLMRSHQFIVDLLERLDEIVLSHVHSTTIKALVVDDTNGIGQAGSSAEESYVSISMLELEIEKYGIPVLRWQTKEGCNAISDIRSNLEIQGIQYESTKYAWLLEQEYGSHDAASIISSRKTELNDALTALQSSPLETTMIEPRVLSATHGISLHAARQAKRGDVLMSIPRDMLLMGEDIELYVAPKLREELNVIADSHSDFLDYSLVLTLISALKQKDARALYFQALVPDHDKLGLLTQLDPQIAEVLASYLGGSIAFRRAQHRRKEMLSILDRIALLKHHFNSDVVITEREWLWACSVVQTRAIRVVQVSEEPSEGASVDSQVSSFLSPYLDLCNHRSGRMYSGMIDCNFNLIADSALDAGEEITISYDPDADYLDLYERYAFFDMGSSLHTVEIEVRDGDIVREVSNELESDDQLWQRLYEIIDDEASVCQGASDAISEATEDGNGKLRYWWLPDHRPTSCPFFRAVRRCLSAALVNDNACAVEVKTLRIVHKFVELQLALYKRITFNQVQKLTQSLVELASFEQKLLRQVMDVCESGMVSDGC